ncbi:sulfotransferase [Nocardiopsis sp. EMB25]|uniref:sulfotransferase family protein n=1 Tax=Nocardiopsis sp. EMB25 TaxID=2835867 RepID=UPI002283C274|nr:sulfotransferase [Nocardiopsis sp. EMB25]MCY9784074.1 sulfotransferase [Nocardiopsis sp. EMB25]
MNVRPTWWVHPVNTLIAPVAGRRPHPAERSFDAATRAAAQRTGLTWPVDEPFLSDLRVLHEAWHAVPDLTPIGRVSVQAEIRRRLETRLRMLHLLDVHPEVADEPIDRPVFITGLPRTGTTFGHGLLAAHADARAPMLWELWNPVPDTGRPGERTLSRRRRLAAARALVRGMDAMLPGFQTIHPMHPLEPEECVFALPHGLSHHVRAPIPGYRAWVERRDAVPDYAYLKQQLQALQWKRPRRRWVLKSPLHLLTLDALLDVFPDATVVLTDRDPARAMASWGSLTEAGMRLHCADVDPSRIGGEWLEIWSKGAERARAVRRAHDPGRFLDLPYDELTRDPVAVAERTWRALGAEFDAESRNRTLRYTRRDRRKNPGGHRYGPERYGLDPDRVRAVFGPDPMGAGAVRG